MTTKSFPANLDELDREIRAVEQRAAALTATISETIAAGKDATPLVEERAALRARAGDLAELRPDYRRQASAADEAAKKRQFEKLVEATPKLNARHAETEARVIAAGEELLSALLAYDALGSDLKQVSKELSGLGRAIGERPPSLPQRKPGGPLCPRHLSSTHSPYRDGASLLSQLRRERRGA